jgi:outer membrane lipoprotein carrier protein
MARKSGFMVARTSLIAALMAVAFLVGPLLGRLSVAADAPAPAASASTATPVAASPSAAASTAKPAAASTAKPAAATSTAKPVPDAPVPDESDYPPAVARLQTFIDTLKTLEADFVQRIEKVDAAGPKESTGHFSASKPGMFRWDYRAPFEQLIVSDGKTVWYYEPDLLQATRADAARLNETPAAFLVSGSRIAHMFTWKVRPNKKWKAPDVLLMPRKESPFHQIVITLHPEKDEILELIVEDTLGHRSFFTFERVKINQSIPLDQFHFEPPKDVDIIDG